MNENFQNAVEQAKSLIRGKILLLEEEKQRLPLWQLKKRIAISDEILSNMDKINVLLRANVLHITDIQEVLSKFTEK